MAENEERRFAILVVDDEKATLRGVSLVLRSHGLEPVLTCSDGREVAGLLEEHPVSLLLLDLIMPNIGGEEILQSVSETHPDLPVIVVTADADVETAVRCMKLGAVDYLLKPLEAERLIATVERTLEQAALRFESTRLREQFFESSIEHPDCFAPIVTQDPGMFRLFAYMEAIARGSHPVLVSGETGTGKELIARALHAAGQRNTPFVAVNVAGLDDAMFSDTLFGHETGAFTGAGRPRSGLIEKAADGTLFLDEIGDLSDASQVKLLRLLQEREYLPLGSDSPRKMRARVVAATHREPSCLREDLYYRLRSYHVRIPPLRDRLGDLPLLVDRFLDAAAEDLGKDKPSVPPELFLHLCNHRYPGNVRELRSMVFDAVARHGQGVVPLRLFLDQLTGDERGEGALAPAPATEAVRFPFPLPTMKQIQESAITEALERVQGNQSAAARMLDVSRVTISRSLARGRRGDGTPETE